MIPAGVLTAALAACVSAVTTGYLERYFETYPSRATSEGRHDRDAELEDFSEERLAAWARTDHETRIALLRLLPEAAGDERIDAEVLLRQVEQELLSLETRRRPDRDPLLWTGVAANAVVFLLMRDDAPEEERLAAAEARALRGEDFALRHFTDGMLELGSVSIRYYRERLLAGRPRLERRLLRGALSPSGAPAERPGSSPPRRARR